MNTQDQFLFGIYPYIALTVFLLGSLVRFDREQYAWKSDSSQLLYREWLRLGNNLFHVGILGLFFGHRAGLLTPVVVWDTLGVSHGLKQTVAMAAGGVMGSLCLAGLLILIHRRLTDPRIAATTRPGDRILLVWILATLLLGLSTIWLSAGHRDGVVMVQLMGPAHRHFPRRRRQPHRRRTRALQGASIHGDDAVRHLPLHPAGARVERLCLAGLPDPRLAARAAALTGQAAESIMSIAVNGVAPVRQGAGRTRPHRGHGSGRMTPARLSAQA